MQLHVSWKARFAGKGAPKAEDKRAILELVKERVSGSLCDSAIGNYARSRNLSGMKHTPSGAVAAHSIAG